MKKIKIIIAENLLHFAVDFCPDTENGKKIKYLIGSYFDVFKK